MFTPEIVQLCFSGLALPNASRHCVTQHKVKGLIATIPFQLFQNFTDRLEKVLTRDVLLRKP
jgi:hypothetical protein